MTQIIAESKLLAEIKHYLTQASYTCQAPWSRPGQRSLVGGPPPYFSLLPLQPKNSMDEVYPRIWLGDASCAQRPGVLKEMKITHVVNASMGTHFSQTNTDPHYYHPFGIKFYGIPAIDIMTFNIQPYFYPAANFIDEALSKNGKVYIHCQQGISRSASIVLAFLMLKRDMDLLSAVKLLRQKREIFPNDGFLRQLCHLNNELFSHRTPARCGMNYSGLNKM